MPSNIKDVQGELAAFERDLHRVELRMDSNKQQLLTYLMLLQRLHLPAEAEAAISIMVRTRMAAEQAYRSLLMLMAASGPWGWAMAMATGAASLMTMASVAADVNNELKGAP